MSRKPKATPQPKAPSPIDISTIALAAFGRAAPMTLTPIIEMPAFDPQTMLRPYQPPPGVRPANAPQLAMDEAFPFGMGALSGLNSWTQGMGFLGYPFLSELSQRPEYRRASEIIAKEMTRKWIKLTSTGTDKKNKGPKLRKLEDAMQQYRLQDVFRDATELDGFFGRGQIYIDTDQTEDVAALKLPLTVDKRTIKKGMLKGFKTVEPIWTSPNQYNASDPLNVHFYKPQTWFVNGKELHKSRLLTMIGRKLPDILKPAYNFGGISLSQLGLPYVNNWLRTRQSVSDITHSYNVPVLKTTLGDLTQLGAAQILMRRARGFNAMRDNSGLFVLDKESEDFIQVSASLASLDKLQAQAQEHMSSVWGIPLVVLLGITPSGLNASSDGEIRTFYAWIRAQQEALYNEPLKTCLEIIQLSTFGEIDPEIGWEYVSLWELDEAGRAVVRKAEADTHAVYLADGVVSNEEVREVLANDEGGVYSSLDLADTPAPTPPDQIEESPRIGGDPAKQEQGKSGVGEA